MDFYTLSQLTEKTGISVRSFREFIKNGDLKASKIGKTYIVTEADFIEFIQQFTDNRAVAFKNQAKEKE